MRGTHKFEGSYFKAAWALLTRDKGWIKPVLALTAAGFIPLFGQVAQLGYGLEWARLTAWGIDAAPKQRGVSVGTIIKSGFRGLGVVLGLTIVASIATSIVVNIFSSIDWLSSILAFASSVIMLFMSIISLMAALRAAIYQRIGAGYQIDRLWDMLSADFNGITWITLGNLGWSILAGIITSIIAVIFTFAAVPSFGSLAMWVTNLSDGAAVTGAQLAQILRQLVTVYAPLVAFETMFVSFVSTILTLVVLNALGLWLRQFNVPNWGLSEDPLPPSLDPAPPVYTGPAVPFEEQLPPESTQQELERQQWEQQFQQWQQQQEQQKFEQWQAQQRAEQQAQKPAAPVQGDPQQSAWEQPAQPVVPAAPVQSVNPAAPVPEQPVQLPPAQPVAPAAPEPAAQAPTPTQPEETVTPIIPLPGDEQPPEPPAEG